jgi:tetratricopeptide (TPR) repeat protein
MELFWAQLENQGYDHALEIARECKQNDTSFAMPESDVNDLAFILLGKGMKSKAIDIFKYNLAVHPNSADAYEGLAEGYDDAGQKELALENFKQSAKLNPNNSYAADRIKKLEGEMKQ